MKSYCFAMIAALLLLTGCGDKKTISAIPDHVMFLYLGMDNNLAEFGRANINGVKAGMEAGGVKHSVAVIFKDFPNEQSSLIKLSVNSKGKCEQTLLIDYKENLNSAKPEVMTRVINDMKRLVAGREYLLFIGSHGTGWVPPKLISSSTPRSAFSNVCTIPSRDIIDNEQQYMNVEALAAAIPAGVFSALIFDACLMGNIETAFPFRNKVSYFAAAPSQIYVDGIPYSKIMRALFDRAKPLAQRLSDVCRITYEHYANFSTPYGYTPGSNMVLYDCSKMDRVADVSTRIIDQSTNLWGSSSGIQHYDGIYNPHFFYDMDHAMTKLVAPENPLYAEFGLAMRAMVIAKYTSLVVYDVAINNFSGVTMFVPQTATPNRNQHYKNTSWYQTIYRNNPLP